MSLQSRAVDPLFYRHELMFELGRLDMYIASVDEQAIREHQAQNDDPQPGFVCIDSGAIQRRAIIHESLSDVPA